MHLSVDAEIASISWLLWRVCRERGRQGCLWDPDFLETLDFHHLGWLPSGSEGILVESGWEQLAWGDHATLTSRLLARAETRPCLFILPSCLCSPTNREKLPTRGQGRELGVTQWLPKGPLDGSRLPGSWSLDRGHCICFYKKLHERNREERGVWQMTRESKVWLQVVLPWGEDSLIGVQKGEVTVGRG